ncbi:MAG: molybdopterin molybdotransferase MoeA [Eubacteriales bacterium]|nr:molybdopterin molybdotransferase MoeA [Eubacteriales bacterium]
MEGVTVEQAVELILAHTPVIAETEEVGLLEASGRILARDMEAAFDNPPFDRSPVDGYACRTEDVAGASKECPARLTVVEEIDAGQFSRREVKAGEAVRIMTGAAVPAGCDCCIRQEDTDYGEETVEIYCPEKKWGNFCFAGEDFKKGTVLLRQGMRLGYVEAAVLAGMGVERVPVYRLPRVALLTSGDEVVEPGQVLSPGKIYNSNLTMLEARLMEFGVRPFCAKAVEDDPAVMAEELCRAAKQADLIVTTGAVSVGKKDIMHESLGQIGAERVFWRVQVKPGMPTLFSVYKGIPVLSLSGNPFGVAVTVELLIRPMLQKMMRDESLGLVRVKGVMAEDFEKPIRGRRLVRAIWEDGVFRLPRGLHSNGVLSSMAGCNCLIDAGPETGRLMEGCEAEAILL